MQDAVLVGCVADGRAAKPWTAWPLTEMRAEVAIKNGWIRMADGDGDVDCLAVPGGGVRPLTGHAIERDPGYGARHRRDIAETGR